MSNKNRKKQYQKNLNKNNLQQKKILDGLDLVNSYKKESNVAVDTRKIDTNEDVEKNNSSEKHFNLNEHIQTFISILFSFVIFLALVMLMFVLYNNYIKKDNSNCSIEEVCKDLIKKDYNIKEDDILAYLMNLRGVVYNIEEFDKGKLDNNVFLNLATYLIWNINSDYELCDNSIDLNCLVTKKEIKKEELYKQFKKYFNLNNINLNFYNDFTNEDTIRIYEKDEYVILTFSEFEYQTLKHDLIDIRIDEDNISVIFALSENIKDTDDYKYIGYKSIELKYIDNNFIIENIKTSTK